MVFGMGYIQDYCNKTGLRLDEYMTRLAVHGMCHLIGYDHTNSLEEARQMREKEMFVLRTIWEWRTKEQLEKDAAAAGIDNPGQIVDKDKEKQPLEFPIEWKIDNEYEEDFMESA